MAVAGLATVQKNEGLTSQFRRKAILESGNV